MNYSSFQSLLPQFQEVLVPLVPFQNKIIFDKPPFATYLHLLAHDGIISSTSIEDFQIHLNQLTAFGWISKQYRSGIWVYSFNPLFSIHLRKWLTENWSFTQIKQLEEFHAIFFNEFMRGIQTNFLQSQNSALAVIAWGFIELDYSNLLDRLRKNQRYAIFQEQSTTILFNHLIQKRDFSTFKFVINKYVLSDISTLKKLPLDGKIIHEIKKEQKNSIFKDKESKGLINFFKGLFKKKEPDRDKISTDEIYLRWQAQMFFYLARSMELSNSLSEAEDFYQQFLQTITQSKEGYQPVMIGLAYAKLGDIYRRQKKYSKAIELFGKSLEIYQKYLKVKFPAAEVYHNFAMLLLEVKAYSKSETFFRLAYDLYEQMDNLNVLAAIELGRGALFLVQKKTNKSYSHLMKSRELFEKTGEKTSLASVFNLLSQVERERFNISASTTFAKKTLEIASEIQDIDLQTGSFFSLAANMFIDRNWEECKDYIEQGIKLCLKIEQPHFLQDLSSMVPLIGRLTDDQPFIERVNRILAKKS